jgi:protein-disulfide isomerase
MKTAISVLGLLLTLGTAVAQNNNPTQASPAPQPPLPGNAQVEQALKRIYGYDPSIHWKVFAVRRSVVPGMSEVFLQLKNEFHHLFITADGKYAIDGDMQPFGADPYGGNRERLKAGEGIARGPAQPAVTMVEFSDLQCPHCKDAQPVLEKLAADFPEMQVVFQHYPLVDKHPWAMKAAQYADCAARSDANAAWKFIAEVYAKQDGIALATADEKLSELAAAAGLDASGLAKCIALPETEARIRRSIALGDSVGVMGTPTVFVNGRMLEPVMGMPYEQVKAMVAYEIQNAGK